MNRLKPISVALSLGALFSALAASAQDHPLVPVYPGSKLNDRKAVAFDEFQFPAGKMWANKFTKELPLEGKIERLKYSNPPERSTLELLRNYETALKQAGFQILFSCSKEECGSGDTETQVGHYAPAYDTRFISAKLPRPEGDVYAAINISGYYHDTWITVVEVKPMDEAMSGRAAAASPRAQAPSPADEPPARSPERATPAASSSRGGGKQVVTGVVKGLGQFGIQAKAGSASEKADIIVEGEVETNPFQGNDARIKWARTTATITLRDGRTSKIFTQFNVTDRQGSGDYNEAVRRSQTEIGKKVAAQINSEIAAYFENQ
ncbi:MAG TPA: hypothetical protein DCZ01_06600 [Elusimicrobia bacterium]|nr:MAG: hypothetical protein A2X37_11935 [Elusimicrobia bacterium GWA2_66_18]OGR70679.1 MAG: hypothetical protein A2X40_06105 [Elusimicrobia bacterium GWC2_65_9]HAZ08179.1 hypothetical protein [Elusimicrobiota bacterium]